MDCRTSCPAAWTHDTNTHDLRRDDRFRFLKRRIGADSRVRGEIGCSLGYTCATPRSCRSAPCRPYAVARMRFSGTTPAATRTDWYANAMIAPPSPQPSCRIGEDQALGIA